MGRFLPILIIVAICLIVCSEVRKKQQASQQTHSSATGAVIATPTPSVRPDFEAACKGQHCELISFKPLGGNEFEIVVRGPNLNSINEILTDLGPPPEGTGVLKEKILKGTTE